MRLDWMILLLLVPGIAFCLPYWPEQPDGVVYHYAHPDGETLSIRYSQSGSIQDREYLYSDPDCTGGESYQISDDQVGLGEHGYYCQGGIDPVMEFFDPPLPIARSEMQPGDTWTWEGQSLAGPGLVIVSVAEETIETGLGTMDVLRVSFYPTHGQWLPYQDLYLHPWLGPVRFDGYELVGWDGPVAIESRTLSDVKTLFRYRANRSR